MLSPSEYETSNPERPSPNPRCPSNGAKVSYLDLITGEEAGVKDDRRIRNALHLSRLPHHKTLVGKLRTAETNGRLDHQLRPSLLIVDLC